VRVLVVAPKASGVSGVGQHVRCLIKGLTRLGHSVDLVSSENTPCLKVRGLVNASFSIMASAKLFLSPPYPPAPYDVVHAHNVLCALPMKVAWAKRRVLTLHGVFSDQAPELHRWLPRSLVELAELKALSWADVVTAVSEEAVSRYSSLGFKVHYVPNAIDLSELPSRGVKLFSRQVVYVGRFSWEKGVDVLIRAIAKLPSTHLVLIGEGPEEARLKRMADGLPNVHFMGSMAREEALTYVKGSDLLVQPSRREGLSTAVLEAMAMGVPVIASSVGGNLDLIKPRETGLLVPPGDVDRLASTIHEALQDPELLREMALRAKAKVAEEYSWSKVLERYLSLYEGEAH